MPVAAAARQDVDELIPAAARARAFDIATGGRTLHGLYMCMH